MPETPKMTPDNLRSVILPCLNSLVGSEASAIEARALFVVIGRSSSEPRILVYRDNAHAKWGWLLFSIRFDPLTATSKQLRELGRVAARRLELNEKRVSLEPLYDGQLFLSTKPDRGARDKPTVYVYTFVLVKVAAVPLFHPMRREGWTHPDARAFPRAWKTIAELKQDRDTRENNGDVIELLETTGAGLTHQGQSLPAKKRILVSIWDQPLLRRLAKATGTVILGVATGWAGYYFGPPKDGEASDKVTTEPHDRVSEPASPS